MDYDDYPDLDDTPVSVDFDSGVVHASPNISPPTDENHSIQLITVSFDGVYNDKKSGRDIEFDVSIPYIIKKYVGEYKPNEQYSFIYPYNFDEDVEKDWCFIRAGFEPKKVTDHIKSYFDKYSCIKDTSMVYDGPVEGTTLRDTAYDFVDDYLKDH